MNVSSEVCGARYGHAYTRKPNEEWCANDATKSLFTLFSLEKSQDLCYYLSDYGVADVRTFFGAFGRRKHPAGWRNRGSDRDSMRKGMAVG